MQRLDQKKREHITRAAVRLFAARPFHEVKLDDVAAAAKVGKGTLYLYFKNKEDLYVSLIQDGFVQLVDRLHEQLAHAKLPAWEALERVVSELSRFAVSYPDLFELMRSVPLNRLRTDKRRELTSLIQSIICRGIKNGEMCDGNPELTATFIPAMVRSAMLFGPKQTDAVELASHILALLSFGLKQKGAQQCR